jgi:cell pole-organizing protein PopZ
MSRETFMRTSTPQEPSVSQRYFTPITPQDSEPAAPVVEKASPLQRSDEASVTPARVVDKPGVDAPSEKPESESSPEAATVKPDIEQKLLAPPEASESKPAEFKTTELKPAELKSTEAKPIEPKSSDRPSTTATIEAQLVELIDEDLKALRETAARDAASQTSQSENVTVQLEERAAPMPQTPSQPPPEGVPRSSADAKEEKPKTSDNGDPFVFDLGPSPFAPRPTSERPAEPKISIDPAPAAAPRDPLTPMRDRDATPQPGRDHKVNKVNGASHHRQEPSRPAGPPSPRGSEPSPASRPAPTFAVPSVSATLGPHRRLEPLSEAFKPEPPSHDYRRPEFPQADPFSQRDYVRSAAFPSEPVRGRQDAMLQPAPPMMGETKVSTEPVGDRTMEDAVADLLRPLLKTWLAENMPKIVERALRREMTERLLPDQKNSRD